MKQQVRRAGNSKEREYTERGGTNISKNFPRRIKRSIHENKGAEEQEET
jgi:hypothetical protein